MRRRRRRSRKSYTLGYLIAKQPKGLAKLGTYRALRDHYLSSPALRSARIPSRAYRLLNEARLQPEHLANFYRTYRLPQNPFFPLFLAAKSEYLAIQVKRAEARRRWIRETMRSLPDRELEMVRYLGRLECAVNAAGRSPVWQERLYPGTKKRAREYQDSSPVEWLSVFRSHTDALTIRYPVLRRGFADRILALYLLDLSPRTSRSALPPFPPALPPEATIRSAYRSLSMRYHPDQGGDPARFIHVKWARDTLLGQAPASSART